MDDTPDKEEQELNEFEIDLYGEVRVNELIHDI